jgi:hypothetical protein
MEQTQAQLTKSANGKNPPLRRPESSLCRMAHLEMQARATKQSEKHMAVHAQTPERRLPRARNRSRALRTQQSASWVRECDQRWGTGAPTARVTYLRRLGSAWTRCTGRRGFGGSDPHGISPAKTGADRLHRFKAYHSTSPGNKQPHIRRRSASASNEERRPASCAESYVRPAPAALPTPLAGRLVPHAIPN